MSMSLLWTIAVYICSVFVCIGVYKTKVDSLVKRVDELELRDKTTEIKLTNIQVQLADIQSKLGLLIDGKVRID